MFRSIINRPNSKFQTIKMLRDYNLCYELGQYHLTIRNFIGEYDKQLSWSATGRQNSPKTPFITLQILFKQKQNQFSFSNNQKTKHWIRWWIMSLLNITAVWLNSSMYIIPDCYNATLDRKNGTHSDYKRERERSPYTSRKSSRW